MMHTHLSSIQRDELIYLTKFICDTQIYILMNDSNTHWYLVVIDIKTKQIQYFDTMSSSLGFVFFSNLGFVDRKKKNTNC
jgi:Ulp1 family protease